MVLATRGRRETETGTEPVTDPVERETLRRQATAVYLRAGLLALGLEAITLLL